MEMRGVLGSGMLAHTEDLLQVWLSRCVSIASTNLRVLKLVSPLQIRRVSATEVTETKNIVNMVVVLQQPRETRGGFAYVRQQGVFDPEVDIDRVSTMNKRQRQIVLEKKRQR